MFGLNFIKIKELVFSWTRLNSPSKKVVNKNKVKQVDKRKFTQKRPIIGLINIVNDNSNNDFGDTYNEEDTRDQLELAKSLLPEGATADPESRSEERLKSIDLRIKETSELLNHGHISDARTKLL